MGKVKEKLAEMIETEFMKMGRTITIEPSDLKRHFNGNNTLDIATWSANFKSQYIDLYSWDRMTDIVKRKKIHLINTGKVGGSEQYEVC